MTDIELPDGRVLEAEITGPDDGDVLVYHHGTPECVLQDPAIQRAASAHGLRLVTWSRPGYAGSTRAAGRTVADIAGDTAAVLGYLGVHDCYVAGWSGGGPHALACAALLPDRVRSALVIAGVAPYDAEGLDFLAGMGEDNLVEFGAALEGKAPLRAFLDQARSELADIQPEQISESMASLMPATDIEVLTGEFAEFLAASFRRAVSTGVDGWLDDDLAFSRPWGFDLAEITVPVAIWQGSADLMVPFSHGQWLAGHVPGATVHLEDGLGHLSIAVGSMEEVIAELVELGA
jgi:pimeloyl-ACP methyl ester carboxylesterase